MTIIQVSGFGSILHPNVVDNIRIALSEIPMSLRKDVVIEDMDTLVHDLSGLPVRLIRIQSDSPEQKDLVVKKLNRRMLNGSQRAGEDIKLFVC